MPLTAIKLMKMLNFNLSEWKCAGKLDNLPLAHKIQKPTLLFSIIEDEMIEKQINKLAPHPSK